ncbi:MAG: hypothetical protein R3250_15140 [Melioribacteraceae bacterium]|nr:hypothetical protein [Melioribacteraceae bacterium]
MTIEQLIEVMKYHLKNFSTNDVEITNDTFHKDILSDSDGFGSANSKRIYKAFIRWTLLQAGLEDKTWPKNWIELSVTELAKKLIAE